MIKMLNWLINKSLPFQYRFISLMATSTVYWMKEQDHSIGTKIIIIASISIASFILDYLYENNRSSKQKILYLVLLETFCINLIIISSLGLESPYIWYALNSILIASLELKTFHSYLIFAVYVCCFSLSYLIDSQLKIQMEFGLISSHNLLLGIFLAVGAVQLIAKYSKAITDDRIKLYEFNNLLLNTNEMIKDLMGSTMEVSKSAYYFQTQNDKSKLVKYLVDCVGKVCGTNNVVYFEDIDNFVVTENLNNHKKLIISELSKRKDYILKDAKLHEVVLGEMQFIVVPIRTEFSIKGIFGIQIDPLTSMELIKEKEEQLKFISVLSAISFERFELEILNKKILINNEQNRIANEIHDGVLQKLFGASCSMYRLRKKLRKITDQSLIEEADNISFAISESMKDLRSTIYGLSSQKNGKDAFGDEIDRHLQEIKRLHKVNVERQINGNDEFMTIHQKKVVYKIICESIGNAIRHGNATTINIVININPKKAQVFITDNGSGFHYDHTINSTNNGLGLFNMSKLAHSIDGQFCIESSCQAGTKVTLSFNININNLNDRGYKAGENFSCG